ncbi:MAG: hypothetical protein KIT31_22495 [Deltaproteobacteria bacterium]|nr:hypothetical protein [Deltaproteobacteria bacterium]
MNRTFLAATTCLAACGASRPNLGHSGGGSTEVTVYRDRALVAQRVELDVGPDRRAVVRLTVAAGVAAEDVFVLDKNELVTIAELHATRPGGKPAVAGPEGEPAPDVVAPGERTVPTEVELVVAAPRAGKYALRLGYTTDKITWDTAYTMTTTPARDRVVVRGAMAIKNATGVSLPGARVSVVDADLGLAANRVAETLRDRLVGTDPSTTPAAVPRDLGRYDLADGDTRVELLAHASSRRMRSVLVFDPIGTKLDHAGTAPARELELGVKPSPSRRVTESFEVDRDTGASTGLPAGPVRLLERRPDGSLAVLGESRMFEVSTRVANVDAIAIGTAEGVSGVRERREITVDDDGKRLAEEFLITLENTRTHPVEIVLREHLYRGQNWTLAYESTGNAEKEGPQQIAMRTRVPAKGTARVLYVVVYTWGDTN